jgi:arsenate reductase-like glutaredoxin family protein
LRDELKVELDERDYVKQPLSVAELKELFRGRDPRDFLNRKSAAFKQRELAGKDLSADETIALMAAEPNFIKRPLIIAGGEMIAGLDRDRLNALFGRS